MLCLVFVKFLPGGSLSPQEFFARINARWSCLDSNEELPDQSGVVRRVANGLSPRSGVCIADYDSVEQLGFDLSIMPGAGISGVEVVPISDEADYVQSAEAVLAAAAIAGNN